MHLERLQIERFRLIQQAVIELAPGVNLFTGANAQGKTTILEAIAFLATGRSFRTARDRECIAWTAKEETRFAAVDADFRRSGARHRLRLAIEPRGKTVWLDGNTLRTLTSLWGRLNTVLFVPADLQIVQGPPGLRRSVLDSLLGQTNPSYLQILAATNRALGSRNALLRRGRPSSDPQYEAFEATLAQNASSVLKARAELAVKLDAAIAAPMEHLTGGTETLRVIYEPGFPAQAKLTAETILAVQVTELTERLIEYWQQARAGDLDRGSTRDGAQRDDLRFEVNGSDARTYASQGQTRSCVVALRLAELELLSESSGETPLLLLDDIFGELDRRRAELFLSLLGQRPVQTLITATDAALVEAGIEIDRRFLVNGGDVVPDSPQV